MKGKNYTFTFKRKGVQHTVFTFQFNAAFAWNWFKSEHPYARDVICKEG